jgi:hypothetical protein
MAFRHSHMFAAERSELQERASQLVPSTAVMLSASVRKTAKARSLFHQPMPRGASKLQGEIARQVLKRVARKAWRVLTVQWLEAAALERLTV